MRAARRCARSRIWLHWGAYHFRDLTKIGSRPLPPRCRLPTRSPQFERGGRGGRGGEGGWLRGDGQPSPMPFPCSLRRRVWSAARAGAQGPCAPVPTKGLDVGCNMGWCDKWGMRVSQGFAMGGIDPVRVLMKPANHRSTGMRHSPRLLPLGHMGKLAQNLPSVSSRVASPEVTIVLSP